MKKLFSEPEDGSGFISAPGTGQEAGVIIYMHKGKEFGYGYQKEVKNDFQ